jgi:hypothetical protein
LITLILRSISFTCSLAAVIFTGISFDSFSSGLNSMSMRHSLTIKPPRGYNLATDSKLLSNCSAVWLGKNSIVFSLMSLECVTKNGKPFANITSAARINISVAQIMQAGSLPVLDKPYVAFFSWSSPSEILCRDQIELYH